MADSPIAVIINYTAQPGQGSRARAELTALVKQVVALEPDCRGIRVYQDPGDDTRILLYELWTSREAFEGPHMQTPHIGAFMAKARDFIAGPPTIEFWRLTDDVVPTP